MAFDEVQNRITIDRQLQQLGIGMVGYERWKEIRRQHFEDGDWVSAIARRMELDRKADPTIYWLRSFSKDRVHFLSIV